MVFDTNLPLALGFFGGLVALLYAAWKSRWILALEVPDEKLRRIGGYVAKGAMAFLVRDALERGHTLEDVLKIYRETPRTCQYFYVVADAKTNEAVGMEASWDVMTIIKPGESDPRLPHPVKDCALLSAGGRYKELVRRVEAGHGEFTPETALRLMDRGVAMKSNLHNVLFEPKTTKFWIANATSDKQPAADQPYHAFQLSELLARHSDPTSPELPLIAPPDTPADQP